MSIPLEDLKNQRADIVRTSTKFEETFTVDVKEEDVVVTPDEVNDDDDETNNDEDIYETNYEQVLY